MLRHPGGRRDFQQVGEKRNTPTASVTTVHPVMWLTGCISRYCSMFCCLLYFSSFFILFISFFFLANHVAGPIQRTGSQPPGWASSLLMMPAFCPPAYKGGGPGFLLAVTAFCWQRLWKRPPLQLAGTTCLARLLRCLLLHEKAIRLYGVASMPLGFCSLSSCRRGRSLPLVESTLHCCVSYACKYGLLNRYLQAVMYLASSLVTYLQGR